MLKPAIVCATHVIGLAVIRALGEKGVPIYALYYDPRDMGYVSRYVKKAVHVADPVSKEEQFIKDILDLDDKATGGLVIPADDATIIAISRHKKRLQSRYIVAAESETVMDRFIDKSHTYDLARRIGIPSPRTLVVKTRKEAVSVGPDMLPCLVKPCRSHIYFERFHRKMTYVKSIQDLLTAFDEAHTASIDVMLQEYIEGDDTCGYNYNSYMVNGKPVAEFTAEKIRLSPTGFGVPSAVRAKHIPEIIESGRAILSALGFDGYSCTEFKRDSRTGRYVFMEVNGRHNRSALLAVRCGLIFPWIEYQYLVNGIVPSIVPMEYPNRIWIDEFKDCATSLRRILKRELSLGSFVDPYRHDPVFAVYDKNDKRPFIKRFFGLFTQLPKSLSK